MLAANNSYHIVMVIIIRSYIFKKSSFLYQYYFLSVLKQYDRVSFTQGCNDLMLAGIPHYLSEVTAEGGVRLHTCDHLLDLTCGCHGDSLHWGE